MKTARLSLIATAAALALTALPAHAVLQRMGPVSSPTIGGFPAWFQDPPASPWSSATSRRQAELDGGWCVLIPPATRHFPESFPDNFFIEHFYYDDDHTAARRRGNGFKARLIVALEASFAERLQGARRRPDHLHPHARAASRTCPFDGDYRVITPYSDITYPDQKAGDRIFDTSTSASAASDTFECTLDGTLGPFLLPSATAGGAEVPPMPDLIAAPAGTDPFYDLLVAAGGATVDPGTGRSTSPTRAASARSPAARCRDFVRQRDRRHDHRVAQPQHLPRRRCATPADTHDGPAGSTRRTARPTSPWAAACMTGALPGNVTAPRATYKADATGNVTDLDVYAKACAHAAGAPAGAAGRAAVHAGAQLLRPGLRRRATVTDPITGLTIVNPPALHRPGRRRGAPMAETGNDYWGQSSPAACRPATCASSTPPRATPRARSCPPTPAAGDRRGDDRHGRTTTARRTAR